LVENRKFTLPLSCLPPSIGMTPFEFWKSFKHSETRFLQVPDGEDLVILACVVLIQCQSLTDRHTDGRTSLR